MLSWCGGQLRLSAIRSVTIDHTVPTGGVFLCPPFIPYGFQ